MRAFLTAKTDEAPSSARDRLRASYFPDSAAYGIVDLDRLRGAIEPRREKLSRILSSSAGDDAVSTLRDLDRAVETLRLFRFCFFSASIAGDASSVHLRLGFIAERR